MALNKAVFKTRALTALIFVAVMLVGLLWNFYTFFFLFSIIQIGCWFEYVKIIEITHKVTISNLLKYLFIIYGFLFFFLIGAHHWTGNIPNEISTVKSTIKIISIIVLITILNILFFRFKTNISPSKRMLPFGFLYISLPLGMFLFLKDYYTFLGNNNSLGILVPCAIMFSIWINDTMAYIVGSFIGKTPFSKISPKKTWEGTIGGAILCVVVMGLLGFYLSIAQALPVKHWIAIAAICAVFGTLGDLLESKIKRVAGIKDSGTFMPGHGGFLDRFDSLLIAAPAVWIYFQLFVL